MKLLSFLLVLMLSSVSWAQTQTFRNATCSVTFSPKRGATKAITDLIASAKTSIRMEAYSYTSEPIGSALRAAKARGVDVQTIVDRTTPVMEKNQAVLDKAAGIPIFVDTKHRIMHNKVMIVDEFTVLTGSFNFSISAEYVNAENVIICRSTGMSQLYLEEWKLLLVTTKPL